MNKKVSSESFIKDIRRKTRRKFSSEEKIRIVVERLRGEDWSFFLRKKRKFRVWQLSLGFIF